MSPFKQKLKNLWRDRRGSAVVELAISAPLFISLLGASLELGHYLLLHMKAQHAAVAVSDLTTRDDEITEAVVGDIFEAVPAIMSPIDTGENTRVIISAISQAPGEGPRVFWQRAGGGSLSVTSTVGAEGAGIEPPAGIVLRDNETIIMTEFFYEYAPLTFPVIGKQTLVKTSYFRPRLGSLQSIDP